MIKLFCSFILATLTLTLFNGCVSRTTTTHDSLLGSASSIEEDGRVTNKKVIWFWQPEFYKKPK